MASDHRKLPVFVLADEFALRIYRSTRGFPPYERYGLQAQIRRATATREVIYLIDLAARLEMLDASVVNELSQFGGRIAAALVALRKTLH